MRHISSDNIRAIGGALIMIAILVVAGVQYTKSTQSKVPVVFSDREVLENTWQQYKIGYLEQGTSRTLDKQQQNITTSEGQSYTLLRAVWMGDKETFDASLKWTQDVLKHKNDNLHAWLFGKRSNGSFAVLSEIGGNNSATDAETDMALALIFAYHKWGDTNYLDEATAILHDVWQKEVVVIQGKPVLVANDLERNSPDAVIINPSYFSPYAYRVFAQVDTAHDWLSLIDSSYELLEKSSSETFGLGSTTHLPPDWFVLSRKTGEVSASSNQALTTNYSYDALRIPWRIALDWQWYKEPRAKSLLASFSFFGDEWKANKRLPATIVHTGDIVDKREVPAMYAGALGYFMATDQKTATEVYDQKLKILYNPDTNAWRVPLGYYDDNWAWFGIALYGNLITNLAATSSTVAP